MPGRPTPIGSDTAGAPAIEQPGGRWAAPHSHNAITDATVGAVSGSFGLELHNRVPSRKVGNDGRRGTGPPCPNDECGGVRTPVHASSKDTEGYPIRKRVCEDCGTTFVTGERPIFTLSGRHKTMRLSLFSEVDDYHQWYSTKRKRERFGWADRGRRRQPSTVRGGLYIRLRSRFAPTPIGGRK